MKHLPIIAALFLLSACEPVNTNKEANGHVDGRVYDFEVNGTRCISWKLVNAGGITCDFTKPTESK